MKNKNLFLVFGQLSLAVFFLFSLFISKSDLGSYAIGFFGGLSLAFNLAYLISFRKKKEN